MIEVPQAELVDIGQLQLDGCNPKKMKKKQLTALRDAIIRWGFIVSIVTNRDLVVADGEQRLNVAKSLGMKEVLVIRLDIEDVDRRLLQILNKLKGDHAKELDPRTSRPSGRPRSGRSFWRSGASTAPRESTLSTPSDSTDTRPRRLKPTSTPKSPHSPPPKRSSKNSPNSTFFFTRNFLRAIRGVPFRQ